MVNQKELNQNFEEALSEFDFEKVESVMKFLDWKWAGMGVPNREEMVSVVRNLFKDLSKNEQITGVGTGGFYVSREEEYVEISFIVARSCADKYYCL